MNAFHFDPAPAWPRDAGALLLRWALPPAAHGPLRSLAQAIAARHATRIDRIDAHAALDGSRLHVYCWAPQASALTEALRDAIRDEAAEALPEAASALEAVRLGPRQDIPGASDGEPAPFHYVVETDCEPGDAEALREWYVVEHLPGLAGVPGSVRARRLHNEDGGPRSFACYELVAPEVLGSPPWLVVRGSDWSSRVRPMFRNTRRTMFRHLFSLGRSREAA
jgi:hypothetical protein